MKREERTHKHMENVVFFSHSLQLVLFYNVPIESLIINPHLSFSFAFVLSVLNIHILFVDETENRQQTAAALSNKYDNNYFFTMPNCNGISA